MGGWAQWERQNVTELAEASGARAVKAFRLIQRGGGEYEKCKRWCDYFPPCAKVRVTSRAKLRVIQIANRSHRVSVWVCARRGFYQ